MTEQITETTETQRHRVEKVDRGGELTEKVIAAAIEVHRHFGPGFLESTYHQALMVELRERSIAFASEVPVDLIYKGQMIGRGKIDLLVESRVVVELKATPTSADAFRRQVVTYLKAGKHPLGLIINFGLPRLSDGISRVVL